MDLISELADLYDEPFADSSQVPTTLVSRLARDHVTVALSGDGGDELFAGYRNYDYVPKLWGYNRRLPRPLRRLAGRALTQLSPDQWNHLNARVWGLVKRPPRPAFAGEKAHRIATVLGHETESALYNDVTSAWKRPTELLVRGRDTIRRDLPALHGRSMVERMMLRDATDYLHNDILTKVDRASMSVSLEVRVPILDHRVAEFAWSLPYELKHRDQTRKWLLRQVLYRHVPQALMDRPKQGFSIPVGEWLRGPLRSWAESLIGPDALAAQGVLHSAPIEAAWQRHLQGQNHPTTLWFVLMLQAWLQRYPHRLPST